MLSSETSIQELDYTATTTLMASEQDTVEKNSSETELSKIRVMRAFVESQDPSAKVVIILNYCPNLASS